MMLTVAGPFEVRIIQSIDDAGRPNGWIGALYREHTRIYQSETLGSFEHASKLALAALQAELWKHD